MKTYRIKIDAWGIQPNRLRGSIGGMAIVRDGDTPVEAVCRSIERRTGLSVIACRSDGTRLDGRGRPEANTYEITLGRVLAKRFGGGYSVDGRCWIAVPVVQS